MKKWALVRWKGRLRIFSGAATTAILDGEAEHGEELTELLAEDDDRQMLETMRDMAERE